MSNLKEQAIANVAEIYGTDSPGFEACVESEYAELLRQYTMTQIRLNQDD